MKVEYVLGEIWYALECFICLYHNEVYYFINKMVKKFTLLRERDIKNNVILIVKLG